MIDQGQRVTELSEKLKALSHPHRLHIVQDLMEQSSNVTTIQAALQIPQPSVSAHLSRLKTAGIIRGRRNGQEIYYEVIDADSRTLVHTLLK